MVSVEEHAGDAKSIARQYFDDIAQGDYTKACDLLVRDSDDGLIAEGLHADMIEAAEGAGITGVDATSCPKQLAALAGSDSASLRFAKLSVRADGDAYYVQASGSGLATPQQVVVQKYRAGWRITGFQ